MLATPWGLVGVQAVPIPCHHGRLGTLVECVCVCVCVRGARLAHAYASPPRLHRDGDPGREAVAIAVAVGRHRTKYDAHFALLGKPGVTSGRGMPVPPPPAGTKYLSHSHLIATKPARLVAPRVKNGCAETSLAPDVRATLRTCCLSGGRGPTTPSVVGVWTTAAARRLVARRCRRFFAFPAAVWSCCSSNGDCSVANKDDARASITSRSPALASCSCPSSTASNTSHSRESSQMCAFTSRAPGCTSPRVVASIAGFPGVGANVTDLK
jgi:hypothetical protein